MKAFLIYESMFGNTRDVALAIAKGLQSDVEVEVYEVGVAPDTIPGDVELIVVGAPTHQFGISRPSSREEARAETALPLVSPGRGVREWIDVLVFEENRPLVATFDTTLVKPGFLKYMGRASKSIESRLRRKGLQSVMPPESFWVAQGNGPLADGEVERALSWATELAERVTNGVAPPIARRWYRTFSRV